MSSGALTVILTSPRVPPGLLAGRAWRTLLSADLVAVRDAGSPDAVAVGGEIDLVERPDADATWLLRVAAQGKRVVWLAGDEDEQLTHELATEVVGGTGVEVEIMLGSYDRPGARLLDLVEVMDTLRRECPWDRKQTHESLVRYLVEEACETIEAIESADRAHLEEELGDLLLQVVFHARVASEDPDSPFDIDDVAGGIVDKLVNRHPHVFGDVDAPDAATVEANWESIKNAEKGRRSSMDGIPLGLPALSLADKIVGRALKNDRSLSVPSPAEPAYDADALGDVLFALVAAANAADIDPEQALRRRVLREMDAVRGQENAPDSAAGTAANQSVRPLRAPSEEPDERR